MSELLVATRLANRAVIVTGGPGAGKTTLLRVLAGMGYATLADSARALIAERVARGVSRRPDVLTFAREILRRDVDQYVGRPRTTNWVFFDRCLIDALGLMNEVSSLSEAERDAALAMYPFHLTAFVLSPWEAIYVTDAERDQTFAEACAVHRKVIDWYRSCGYTLHEVPRLTAVQRAEYVLRTLATSSE